MFIIKAVAKYFLLAIVMILFSKSGYCEATTLLESAAKRNTTTSISNYLSLFTIKTEKSEGLKDGNVIRNTLIAQGNTKTEKKQKAIDKVILAKDNAVVQTITYNPDNLRELSNLTKEQMEEMLRGCDLEVLADYYYDMEKKYNVNAVFLMALNIEESGYGTSYLARNNNNLGGIKLRSGSYATFESWNDSLEYIASLIDTMYLSEGGPYYNGQSIYGVNVKYCVGKGWATNLNTIANELLNKVEPIVSKNNNSLFNH